MCVEVHVFLNFDCRTFMFCKYILSPNISYWSPWLLIYQHWYWPSKKLYQSTSIFTLSCCWRSPRLILNYIMRICIIVSQGILGSNPTWDAGTGSSWHSFYAVYVISREHKTVLKQHVRSVNICCDTSCITAVNISVCDVEEPASVFGSSYNEKQRAVKMSHDWGRIEADKSESGDRRNRRKKYQPQQRLVSTFFVTLTSSWQPIRKGPTVSPW